MVMAQTRSYEWALVEVETPMRSNGDGTNIMTLLLDIGCWRQTRSNGDATILKLLPGLSRGGTKQDYSWVLGGGGNNEKPWRWHKHYEGNDRPKKK